METKIYNQTGKEAGKITLPESVFGLPWNGDLIHQVLTSEMSNRRTSVAHTKTRGEVSGGGKKPWKQKGTGRARHGSTRSPIWRHGGVAHGPKNDKNFQRKVNRKMAAKALLTLLAKKYKDGEIVFVDAIKFETPKTRHAKNFFGDLSKIKGFEKLSKKNNAAFVALSSGEANFRRSFQNFGNVQVGDIRNLNPLDLAAYKFLVVTKPEDAVKFLESKISWKNEIKLENEEEKSKKDEKNDEKELVKIAKKPAKKKVSTKK